MHVSYKSSIAVIYLSSILFLSIFFIFNFAGIAGPATNFFSYYLRLLVLPFQHFALWLLVPYLLIILGRLVVLYFVSVVNQVDPRNYFSWAYGKRLVVTLRQELWDLLRWAGPVALSLFTLSLVLGQLNILNASRLQDERVLGWDYRLTGVYPFIILGNLHYPNWFFWLIEFSFGLLPAILALTYVYLLHRHRALFHECAMAFSCGLVVMLPFWTAIPVLSPHDRFIDNVYNLPVANDLAQALQTYHPQPSLNDFLKDMRIKKAGLAGVMPTSTLPSAHVAWAVLVLYYLARADSRLFLIGGTIAILSILGTVLLTQHYFVDVLAGVVVSLVTISLAWALGRHDEKLVSSNF